MQRKREIRGRAYFGLVDCIKRDRMPRAREEGIEFVLLGYLNHEISHICQCPESSRFCREVRDI